MRKFVAFGLVLMSGFLLVNSGVQVYRCFVPRKMNKPVEVRLVRIEGKNCPLYFPSDQ